MKSAQQKLAKRKWLSGLCSN